MRAWENRCDAAVIDEPFYAAYLDRTGLDHPGASVIIAQDETDWHNVATTLLGPVPGDRAIWYQKLMTHHMLPEIGLDWIFELTNCFLIRSPKEVITSYIKVRPDPTQADLGFVQQLDIFEQVSNRAESMPPVLDARDVLENPRRMLERLCAAVGVPFDDSMLQWPAGRRQTDGVWAPYWYDDVERSTGFQRYIPKNDEVPTHLQTLLDDCQAIYDEMYRHRLTP